MEAADDIAYCTADIEDGYELGLLSSDAVRDLIKDQLQDDLRSQRKLDKYAPISRYRSVMIGHLIDRAIEAFTARYENIMHGSGPKELLDARHSMGSSTR